MSTLTEFKCPACGGAIEFNSTIQKMKCPYCDSEFDMQAIAQHEQMKNASAEAQPMQWESTAGTQWAEGETDGMRVYACKSCGGEIVCDATTSATHCPYCDNPVVLAGNFSGALRPDFIIPFKLDKKAAKESLNNHLKGKFLLPKLFKDQNHIDEIKGVYVPFWLFDAGVDAQLCFNATRERVWEDRNYRYTEISHYNVFRDGQVAFQAVPVDGSSKMEDELMESIEPFELKDAVEFNNAYLAGYLADKYDVDDYASVERANTRIRKSTEDAFRATVQGYSAVTCEYNNVQLNNSKAKYALYPVWLLNTTWQGKKFTFAMNGQTGKFVGNLPIDKKKATLLQVGLSILYCAVACGIASFFI